MKYIIYFVIEILILSNNLLANNLPPDWIFNSEDNNYIYGVGSAVKSHSLGEQIRVATIVAKANLSENIGTYIKSKFINRKLNNNGKISQYQEYLIIQKTQKYLKFIEVLNRWISPQGEIFIRVGIKKSLLNKIQTINKKTKEAK